METSSKTEKERALLKKYLAGNCTAEEQERLDIWYNSFDNSPFPGRAQEKFSISKVKKELYKYLRLERSNKSRKIFQLPVYLRVAALLFLVTSVSLLIYRAVESGSHSIKEYHTLNGKPRVITLDDGSVATLNSGSSLKVRSDFGQHIREVALVGEAYFQVTKDPSKPFIVSTGVLRTRVLGTAFNVQSYKNEGEVTVTVAEGKVRVDMDDESKKGNLSSGITPGQQLIYNKTTQHATVIPVDAEHISAWRTGTLYLDNESIPAIARKLERRFNIKIDVEGKISSDCRYTLRISDETFSKVLQVLTSVSDISYKFNQQDHLIINTTACK